MPAKIKYFFQQSYLVIVASFCFGLLIAATDAALSDKIRQNEIEKLNSKMALLLPDAESFEPVVTLELISPQGRPIETKIYKAVASGKTVGWAFSCRGTGFADKIELVVAVDAEFKNLKGYEVLFSNETPGFGDRIKNAYFRDQFEGAPAETFQLIKTGDVQKIDTQIVAITGATVSSEAVVKTINTAVEQVKNKMIQKGLLKDGQ